MIVIDRPKTKPVTTDLAMKSEMNPSRTRPAAMRIAPTTRARPELSTRNLVGSPAASGATTAADITAIVELAVTFRCRLVPRTA